MTTIEQKIHPPTEETSIVLVLDASGSMDSLTQQTLVSVNNFIKEQQALSQLINQDPLFSLITFANSPSVGIDKVRLSKVGEYTAYAPTGGTALLDGISAAIHHVDTIDWKEFSREMTASSSTLAPKKKVIIAILTDGAENSSRTITHNDLKKLIAAKTAEGWQFVYLGANQDAFKIGNSMGISSSGGFLPTSDGLSQAYRMMSHNVTSYRFQSAGQTSIGSALAPSTEAGTSDNINSQLTDDNSFGCGLMSSRSGLPPFPPTP